MRARSASRSARSASARSRRSRSIARRRAATVIQAPGFFGTPSLGHGGHGRGERVLDRVLGELEVAHVTDQRRQDRGALLAERGLDRGCGIGGRGAVRVLPTRPPLTGSLHACAWACSVGAGISLMSMIGRTSIEP